MFHLGIATSQCSNTSTPFELSVTSATVSSFLSLITLPTNLLVCLAVLIDPKKELRNQFNCFTFNLAIADFLVGCVTEPMSAYVHVNEALDSEHKHKVDKIYLLSFHIPYFISAMASVLTIAALAIERYIALTFPFRYRRHFSVKVCVKSSIVIWIISTIFGVLCVLAKYILASFILINTAILFTGTLVCLISFKIRKSLRVMTTNCSNQSIQLKRESRVQVKLTRTFAWIIAALVCCYVPACALIYYINFCQECDCSLVNWFRDVAFWLILLNSTINPFLYAIRSRAFRDAMTTIIHTCSSRVCCCTGKAMQDIVASVRYKLGRDEKGKKVPVGPPDYGSMDTESSEKRSSSGRVQVQLI